MTDRPQAIDNPTVEPPARVIKPTIFRPLPIRLGEYGQELDKLWNEFEKVRTDGFYAGDENAEVPRFSRSFMFHGYGGRDESIATGEYSDHGEGIKFQKYKMNFIPPSIDVIRKITNTGVLSSDIEFEGDAFRGYVEEETSG